MKEKGTWVIISLQTEKVIHGAERNSMVFSTKEIAYEVARQLFTKEEKFIVVQIPELA